MQNSANSHINSITTPVANLTILLYFILTTIYSYYIYQNFYAFDILFLSLIFLCLLAIIACIFDYKIFYLPKNYKHILLAIFSSIFLFLLSTSFDGRWVNSYFKTLPVFEAELGLGWFKDSVYHASIIQSILNFGYPSTSQHGSPLHIYHVTSHYIESLILLITNIEVYDSFGLLKSFKIFIFLSSLLLLIGRVSRDDAWLYILNLLILIPASVGTWHAIGSHSLWIPTVFLILSSPLLYELMSSDNKISHRSIIFIFTLIIFISLGKISLGFIYALFIGFYLFLKHSSDYRVYLIGSLWIAFYFIYSQFMISNSAGINFDELTLENFYDYILDPSKYFQSSSVSFIAILILSCIKRSKNNLMLVSSCFFVIIISFFICYLLESLSSSDKAYFMLATSQILLTYFILYASKYITDILYLSNSSSNFSLKIRYFSSLFGLIIVGYFLYMPSLSLYNLKISSLQNRIEYANDGLYRNINKKLDQDRKLSFTRSFLAPNLRKDCCSSNTIFSNFRDSLIYTIEENNLNKQDVVMFISNEAFNISDYNYGGKWDYGMFIYAVTGIPLTNAITSENIRGFGLADYNKSASRLNSEDFSPKKSCIEHNKIGILIVYSISPPKMKLKLCDQI